MKNKIIIILSIIIAVQGFFLLKPIQKKQGKIAPKTSIAKPKIKISKPTYKIAIILDDWGYNLNNLENLKQINLPMTLAVLPNLAYSQEIAQEAHLLNKEVILHLPLEPYPGEGVRLEKNTILESMGEKEILPILNNALENVAYASGVSNHQGSKLTTSEEPVRIIFKELKNKGLFFIDSVTSKSVCKKIAKELKIKFAARSVFLDNQLDQPYIEGQIRQLVKIAKIKGEAIGIGHDRKATLEALIRLMPQLQKKENIKFVFASELVK